MATLVPPNLAPNGRGIPDDDMEISSDAGRYHDDDLDIDIDLGENAGNTSTDDYMIDDEVTNGAYGMADVSQNPDDDMLDKLDDGNGSMTYAHETHDEELYDAILDEEGDTEIVERQEYPEDDLDDDTIEDITNVDKQVTFQSGDEIIHSTIESVDNVEGTDLDGRLLYDNLELDEAKDVGSSHARQSLIRLEEQASTFDSEVSLEVPVDVSEVRGNKFLPVSGPKVPFTNASGIVQALGAAVPSDPEQVQASVANVEMNSGVEANTTAVTLGSTDPAREEATNLALYQQASHDIHVDPRAHPVVIVYEGQEINLFPAIEGDEPTQFFLPDRSMVDANLLDFIGACRTILRDHVTENEELEIDVTELGLTLSEDSNQASLFSLADVLDIYVQLSQNDGIDTPDPLYVNLTIKPRFASRMTDLSTLVRDAKGISEVFPSHQIEASSPDVEEYHANGAKDPEFHDLDVERSVHANVEGAEDAHVEGSVYGEEPVYGEESVHEADLSHGVDKLAESFPEQADLPVHDSADSVLLAQRTMNDVDLIPDNAAPQQSDEVEAIAPSEPQVKKPRNDHSEVEIVELGVDDQLKNEIYFDDELLEYSEDEREDAKVSSTHSSSSSTVQGGTSVTVLSGQSVGHLADKYEEYTTPSSVEHVHDLHHTRESNSPNPDNEEIGLANIDYSLADHEHFADDIQEHQEYKGNAEHEHEHQDDLDVLAELDSLTDVHDQASKRAINAGELVKDSPISASSTALPDIINGATPSPENLQTHISSSITRKRSRVDEHENDLVESDIESNSKKSRSS